MTKSKLDQRLRSGYVYSHGDAAPMRLLAKRHRTLVTFKHRFKDHTPLRVRWTLRASWRQWPKEAWDRDESPSFLVWPDGLSISNQTVEDLTWTTNGLWPGRDGVRWLVEVAP